MENTSKRRQYDREFKQEAVRLTQKGDRSIAQVARELGIRPNLLGRWRQEYLLEQEAAFPGNGKRGKQGQEAWEVQKRLQDLEEENAILKKALAIFSRTGR